jgi:hypothetical protein
VRPKIRRVSAQGGLASIVEEKTSPSSSGSCGSMSLLARRDGYETFRAKCGVKVREWQPRVVLA